jgi:hypothetical protein
VYFGTPKFGSKHSPTLQEIILDTIIGDILRGVQTRPRLVSFCKHFSFVSSIEPKKIYEALKDVDWVNAMYEELNSFTRNQVWELVERPKDHNVIETKWVMVIFELRGHVT